MIRNQQRKSDSFFSQSVQAFRGIAIIMVVVFHYISRVPEKVLYGRNLGLAEYFSFGWIGVYLFFIISGYSIGSSLDRSKNASHFLSKRFARIYPAFVIASTVIFISIQFVDVPTFEIGEWSFNTEPVTGIDYFFTMFFFPRDFGFLWVDGVFWTLLVEIKFYFYVALLYFFGISLHSSRSFISVLVVMSFLWMITLILNLVILELILRKVFLAPFWPFFMLGYYFKRLHSFSASIFLLYLICNLVVFFTAVHKPNPFEVPLQSVIIFGVCAFAMLYMVSTEYSSSQKARVILVRGKLQESILALLAFVGKYSYSWYLIHQKLGIALIFFFAGNAYPAWYALGIAIAITLFLSILFSKAFETRFTQPAASLSYRFFYFFEAKANAK